MYSTPDGTPVWVTAVSRKRTPPPIKDAVYVGVVTKWLGPQSPEQAASRKEASQKLSLSLQNGINSMWHIRMREDAVRLMEGGINDFAKLLTELKGLEREYWLRIEKWMENAEETIEYLKKYWSGFIEPDGKHIGYVYLVSQCENEEDRQKGSWEHLLRAWHIQGERHSSELIQKCSEACQEVYQMLSDSTDQTIADLMKNVTMVLFDLEIPMGSGPFTHLSVSVSPILIGNYECARDSKVVPSSIEMALVGPEGKVIHIDSLGYYDVIRIYGKSDIRPTVLSLEKEILRLLPYAQGKKKIPQWTKQGSVWIPAHSVAQ